MQIERIVRPREKNNARKKKGEMGKNQVEITMFWMWKISLNAKQFHGAEDYVSGALGPEQTLGAARNPRRVRRESDWAIREGESAEKGGRRERVREKPKWKKKMMITRLENKNGEEHTA